MTDTSQEKRIADVLAYVDEVKIPQRDISVLTEEEPLPQPDFAMPGPLNVAVGSQIAGFAADVSPALRQAISDAFLLAQLAADKAIETGGGTEKWYDTYTGTLGKIGWTLEASDRSTRDVSGTNAEVHREILTVIAAILAPGATVAGSVVAVLKGLADMDKKSPWITLFQKRSQRAGANQFQISHTVVEQGAPVVRIVGFELDAQRAVTQVLFFRFGSSAATLRQYIETLSVNESVFAGAAPKIAAKLADFVADSIAKIEI